MLLFHRRLISLFFLGFASGLPGALTGSTLQAWFTQSQVSVVTVGALTLVGLPYLWKFIWSPLMDRFMPPWLDRRKGWINLCQIGLCITLFLLAKENPAISPGIMGWLALLIAFISASQDIAIDAYRTDVLPPDERGSGSAMFIFAYRMAMLVSGGLALMMADFFGWRLTYEILALLLAFLSIATYFAPNIPEHVTPPKTLRAAIIDPFKDLWRREGIILLLFFIVFYKFGDAFALSLMSNFLLHGLGFSLTDVGIAYKTVGLFATIVGAFIGGILSTRLGMYRSLLGFGIGQAFSNLMFMWLALVGKSISLLVVAIFIEQFFSGMTAAVFMVFLTSLCHPKFSATHYACLSALSAVGRVLIGPVAGLMVLHTGWTTFFFWSFILSFPGIILLTLLPTKVTKNVQAFEY